MLFFCSSAMACQQKAIEEQSVVDTLITSVIKPVKKESVKIVTVMPDFTQYLDVKEKKLAFFEFIRPMIEEENDRIRWERSKIEAIFSIYEAADSITLEDQEWLATIAKQMLMKNFFISDSLERQGLLRKKDVLPVSLCLAQAANESSWGTSKFAREGNNLFGQWCFTPGCGIAPAHRAPGETNQVKRFPSVNASVNSYVRNINNNNAYRKLRAMREEFRKRGEEPSGEVLANGLINYSSRREAYVKEIQAIIRVNKLE